MISGSRGSGRDGKSREHSAATVWENDLCPIMYTQSCEHKINKPFAEQGPSGSNPFTGMHLLHEKEEAVYDLFGHFGTNNVDCNSVGFE